MPNLRPDWPNKIDIRAGDAALIFTDEGVELVIPGLEDDTPVSEHVQEACAAGMLLRSDNPRFVALRAQLEVLFTQSCKDEAANG